MTALYDPLQHRPLAFLYVFDPFVASASYLSWCLFALGYPEQAGVRSSEALNQARELAHPGSLAFALYFACGLAQFGGNRQEVQERADALLALGSEQGFAFWAAYGIVLKGWALAEGGQTGAGLARMREGLAAFWATGAVHWSPYLLALTADAHRKAGETMEALGLLAEALERAERTGERWYEAELHRCRGELLLACPDPDHAGAEACFATALAVARQQSARMWELRAATSLARLWAERDKAKAHGLLAPVYGWFTEGLATPAVVEAKQLLEELGLRATRAVGKTQGRRMRSGRSTRRVS